MTDIRNADRPAWPALVGDFKVKPSTSAIVVVDLQNFTCSRDHGWGPVLRSNYPGISEYYFGRIERTVLPQTRRLLDWGRSNGARCIFLTIGSALADRRELTSLRNAAVSPGRSAPIPVIGTVEHRIPDAIEPREGDIVLNKVTKSAFNGTGIDFMLRNLGIEFVLVGGALTDSCVESTARDAADHGYRTALVEDCCATFDPRSHSDALACFERIFGVVLSVDDDAAGRNRGIIARG